jgi:hypothetical protein
MNLLYTTTLSENNVSIDLPDDLFWSDEFAWSPVGQNAERTLSGVLIIEESVAIAGRPITLEGAEDMAWVTRETVLRLISLRDMTGKTFTLTLKDARTFTVKFNQAAASVDTKPVTPWKQSDDGDWYTLTLRLLEV